MWDEESLVMSFRKGVKASRALRGALREAFRSAVGSVPYGRRRRRRKALLPRKLVETWPQRNRRKRVR